MRTTVTLADDVVAAIEKLRRERSIGTSDAINELVRAGLSAQHRKTVFRQKTHDLGRGIDFSNVADAIETLDGPNARRCSSTQTCSSTPTTSEPSIT